MFVTRLYRRQPARGFSLIEILITLVLISVGLLGLAGLQAKTSVAEMEAYQRAQALLLAQDMADRIAANKTQAASYVGNDFGTGAVVDCTGKTGFDLDLCEWGNAIRGVGETKAGGTVNVGTLLSGRGCISLAKDSTGATVANRYAIVVAWQGTAATQAPAVTCGKDQYGTDTFRRAVVAIVQLAVLT
jgi:type IV pilus assembly protein PilV